MLRSSDSETTKKWLKSKVNPGLLQAVLHPANDSEDFNSDSHNWSNRPISRRMQIMPLTGVRDLDLGICIGEIPLVESRKSTLKKENPR